MENLTTEVMKEWVLAHGFKLQHVKRIRITAQNAQVGPSMTITYLEAPNGVRNGRKRTRVIRLLSLPNGIENPTKQDLLDWISTQGLNPNQTSDIEFCWTANWTHQREPWYLRANTYVFNSKGSRFFLGKDIAKESRLVPAMV